MLRVEVFCKRKIWRTIRSFTPQSVGFASGEGDFGLGGGGLDGEVGAGRPVAEQTAAAMAAGEEMVVMEGGAPIALAP